MLAGSPAASAGASDTRVYRPRPGARRQDAVKRQDEIIVKQEAEIERHGLQLRELEARPPAAANKLVINAWRLGGERERRAARGAAQAQMTDATRQIAELTLRSQGTTKLAIFFGEPWLVTRSRHRIYGEQPPDREDGSLCHMGTKLVIFGGALRPGAEACAAAAAAAASVHAGGTTSRRVL